MQVAHFSPIVAPFAFQQRPAYGIKGTIPAELVPAVKQRLGMLNDDFQIGEQAHDVYEQPYYPLSYQPEGHNEPVNTVWLRKDETLEHINLLIGDVQKPKANPEFWSLKA